MPKTRTKIDCPSLDDFEPYREPAEKLARLERQKANLEADERRLTAEVDRLANLRRGEEPEFDLDAIDAVLAGGGAPSTSLEATRVDLENVRGKLTLVRRAIEQLRIDLDPIRNQASTELLTGLVPDYVELRRNVVFALCELSDANERLWEHGDELTRRRFAWQHIFSPGRMFEWPSHNLGTSPSAASKFILAEVTDGMVTVAEIEKFIRSDVLIDQLRTAEKSRKELEKTA